MQNSQEIRQYLSYVVYVFIWIIKFIKIIFHNQYLIYFNHWKLIAQLFDHRTDREQKFACK